MEVKSSCCDQKRPTFQQLCGMPTKYMFPCFTKASSHLPSFLAHTTTFSSVLFCAEF